MRCWDPREGLVKMGVAGIFVLAASLAGLDALAAVNPHTSTRPDYCANCHTEEIYTGNCDEVAGFCLLADSVDALCLICHVKEECCPLGQDHQAKLYIGKNTHPSDVRTTDVNPDYFPKTLPVHKGTITCRTCHLHTREGQSGYKMLRIVERRKDGVDWSLLCADCHAAK